MPGFSHGVLVVCCLGAATAPVLARTPGGEGLSMGNAAAVRELGMTGRLGGNDLIDPNTTLRESFTSISLLLLVSVVVAAFPAFAGQDLMFDFYISIVFLVVVAFVAKNGISIIDLSGIVREEEGSLCETVKFGMKQRFCAAVMTSFSCIRHLVSVTWTGAVSVVARQNHGSLFAPGMIAANCLGIILIRALSVTFRAAPTRVKSLSGRNGHTASSLARDR